MDQTLDQLSDSLKSSKGFYLSETKVMQSNGNSFRYIYHNESSQAYGHATPDGKITLSISPINENPDIISLSTVRQYASLSRHLLHTGFDYKPDRAIQQSLLDMGHTMSAIRAQEHTRSIMTQPLVRRSA